MRFAGEAHCDEGRRGSGELGTTATLRRDAEGDGELECVIEILDCFQMRRRAATGVAALRMITGRLDLLRVESNGGCQKVR
jgi:hypothetical protein